MMSENDTIAAVATAPGLSGIGVVRVSGPRLGLVIAGLIGKSLPPRYAVLTTFRDAHDEAIDQGIALFFRARTPIPVKMCWNCRGTEDRSYCSGCSSAASS